MSSDINVQTFSGKVNITSNLLVGTSHLFVDTVNNRVGLVTNTPSAGLHVNSNAYIESNVIVGSDIEMNVTPGRITAGSFVGDGTHITGINSDSGSWVNGTNSNVHLATNGDKVGIGVVEPVYTLDVAGDINITTGSTLRVGGTPAVFSNWGVDGSDIYRSTGNVGIGTTSPSSVFNTHGGALWDGSNMASKVCATLEVDRGSGVGTSANDTGFGGILEFRHHSDSRFVTIESISEAAYSGNIGLGFKTHGGAGPVERMRIDGSGNVGIGTTSPLSLFTIKSNYSGGESSGLCIDATDGTVYNLRLYSFVQAGSQVGYKFRVNNVSSSVDAMTFGYNGNVGIGTSSPAQKLDVAGNIKSTGYVEAVIGAFASGGSRTVYASDVYATSWFRSRGDSGHLWQSPSNGEGWHIYPKSRADMFLRTGSGNGGICGTVQDNNPRGYVHWTTSNEIGFLNSARAWSLRCDANKKVYVATLQANGSIIMASAGDTYAWQPGNDGWLRLQGAASGQGNTYGSYTSLAIGNLYSAGATRFSSDDRVKHFEEEVPALDLIRQLNPYKYKKTSKIYTEDYTGEIGEEGVDWVWEIGLIAQDIEKIPYLEFAVSKPDDSPEDKYGLNYTQFIGVCIQGIKKLDEELQTEKVKTQQMEEDLQAEKVKTQQMEARLSLLESTLQEVDRQLQAEKTENEITRLKLANAENRISILEQSLSSILSKLNI